jgi:hypothetical protein
MKIKGKVSLIETKTDEMGKKVRVIKVSKAKKGDLMEKD